MGLWWLQPGWKDARCSCGSNIWQTGGDPDWGECFDCKVESQQSYDYDPDYAAQWEHDYYCDMCRGYMHGSDMRQNGACYCGAVQLSRSGWPPTEAELLADLGE